MARKREKPLSAPEEVLSSEEELSKRDARKEALERATIARQNACLRRKPTIEDMLCDVVRVATDPDTNPWHSFRTCGQRRYELYGHYPVEYLVRKWGTWARITQVAGIADEPGTKLFKTGRAAASEREHVGRYIDRYVKPYAPDHDRYRKLASDYLILSINDTHGVHLSPFTWACFLQAIKDLRPDCVLLNGDVMDGAGLSRFSKIPGWDVSLKVELSVVRSMIGQIRQFHDGPILLGGGNHGIDRLSAYLAQVAPALADLPSLRIDHLLGLDEFDVTLVQGGSIASPMGEEDVKGGMLMFGFYRWHHGTRLGAHPAAAELAAAGRSGQSGHVHRAQVHYGTNEANAGMSWMCVPMGCTERAGRSYLKGVTTGWQEGFGVAHLFPNGHVHQYPVVTSRGVAVVEGHVYSRPEGMIYDAPTDRDWLAELDPNDLLA